MPITPHYFCFLTFFHIYVNTGNTSHSATKRTLISNLNFGKIKLKINSHVFLTNSSFFSKYLRVCYTSNQHSNRQLLQYQGPKQWPSVEKCSSGQAISTKRQNTGTQTNEIQLRHSMTEMHEVLTNTLCSIF